MSYIFALSQPGLDVSQVGEKAFSLHLLIKAQHPVPTGFVVSNSCFAEFLAANDLQHTIDDLVAQCDNEPLSLRLTSEKIALLMQQAHIVPRLRQEVDEIIRTFDGGPVMVRSSAVGEDSVEASFAGQLESFLTESEPGEIIRNIIKCWSSYWSDRCLSYQKTTGNQLRGMGVVLQQAVMPRYAGVAFSVDPNSSSAQAQKIMIEFCYGLADKLVSGKIVPGRVSIDRQTRNILVETLPESSTGEMVIELRKFRTNMLQLEQIIRQLETQHQKLMDVEWVIDQEHQLMLVQARPVTNAKLEFGQLLGSSDEATSQNEIRRQIFYSNVNVNENYPDPISPFLYSLASTAYYYYFKNHLKFAGVRSKRLTALELSLRNIIGIHCGKMYYNMTSIYDCLMAVPFGKHFCATFDRFVGIHQNYEQQHVDRDGSHRIMHGMEKALNWAAFLFTAPITMLLVPYRVHAFVNEVQDYGKHASERDLESAYHGFFHIRFRTWKRGGSADVAAMLGYGVLGWAIKRWLKGGAHDTVQNSLLKGIDDVVSSIPSQRIWDLAQQIKADGQLLKLFQEHEPMIIWSTIQQEGRYRDFLRNFNQYITDWGFRCSKELTLTEPSFSERPESLLAIIKSYCRSHQAAPETIIHEQSHQRLVLLHQIFGELKKNNLWVMACFKYFALKVLVGCAHKGVRYRELVRMNQAYLYNKLRIILLNIGELFVTRGFIRQVDDVFLLEYGEISRLLYGSYMFPETIGAMVAVRALEYQRFAVDAPEDEIVIKHGEFYQPSKPVAVDADRAEQRTFYGIGACGGKIKGTIRVLNSVLESNKLQHGDILVAKQTDPGWGPVFPLISGLIIERGGMLSHGAIISREFGIPAIVAVKDATKLLKDGQQVVLDGDLGRIDIVVDGSVDIPPPIAFSYGTEGIRP